MLLLPVRSPLIHPGDDLAAIVSAAAREQHPPGMQRGDILVLSSKVLATAEGRIIHLASSQPDEALAGEFIRRLSEACGKTPQFCEAVLQELSRMHGRVLRTCPGAILTEVSPEGLREGTILIANAGLDDSNAPLGHAIGWPEDAGKSVVRLRKELEQKMENGEWRMTNKKRINSQFSILNYQLQLSLATAASTPAALASLHLLLRFPALIPFIRAWDPKIFSVVR